MTDSDFRIFALDVISEIECLIPCTGSRRALALAGRLAAHQSLEKEVLEAARIEAMNDCFRSSMGVHDGRDQAALAAWFVLAPAVKDTIDLILAAVAKAKAARTLCLRYEIESISDTDEELECFTSSEFDSLQERLSLYQEQMKEVDHFCPVPVT